MGRARRTAVRKYHDRVAHLYEGSYDDAYWQWHDALTWDYLKPFLPTNLDTTVLDLGCGPGKWACKLLKSGFRVVCVDISAKMLDQARLNVAKLGALHRAEFVLADLRDLAALPAGGAALAISFGEAIGCTTSPPHTLRQVRRLLERDGVLVATFDNRLAAIEFHLAGGPRALAQFLRDGKTHWLTKAVDEQFQLVTYGPSELRKLMGSAGFEVLDLVGKTVLPMRQYRTLLDDKDARQQLAKIEKGLCRDPAAIGRAAHLQVACRA